MVAPIGRLSLLKLPKGAWRGRGDVTALTNCRGDEDIDAKRSRPSIGKPVFGSCEERTRESVWDDQRITSGPVARRPHSKAEYMTAPERFADSQHRGLLKTLAVQKHQRMTNELG